MTGVLQGLDSLLSLYFLFQVDASASTMFDASRWRLYEENRGLDEPKILPIDLIIYMIPQPRFAVIVRDPVDR